MKRIVAAALLLLAGCASPRVPIRVDIPTIAYPLTPAILRDRVVAEGFEQLLKRSGYGRLPFESAAFLVLDDGGGLRLQIWPATNRVHEQRWTGAIPDGTIAVVHTHPAHLPYASSQDRLEARRLGIPVVVLTPGAAVAVGGSEGKQLFAARLSPRE